MQPQMRMKTNQKCTFGKQCQNLAKRKAVNLLMLIVLSFTMLFPAYAMEVPVSSTEMEINGKQVLTEVYTVSEGLNLEDLVKEDFMKNDFLYTFDSITKNELTEITKKEVEQDFTLAVSSKDLDDHIDELQPYIEYTDGEGFEGKIYLDPTTVKITTDGYKSTSSTISETKTYTGLAYNDPTLIPSTIRVDGRTLNVGNVQWSEEGYIEGSMIPSSYKATATYSTKKYYNVATGYTMSAKYSGEVEQKLTNVTEYTVTYSGTPLQAEITSDEVLNEMNRDSFRSGYFGYMSQGQVDLFIVLGVICAILFIAMIVIFIVLLVNKKKHKPYGT